MTKIISQSYLDGIVEGRQLLKAWQAEGFTDIPALAQASLESLNRLCTMYDATNPVGQMMRGERDFWRNQIKKHQS